MSFVNSLFVLAICAVVCYGYVPGRRHEEPRFFGPPLKPNPPPPPPPEPKSPSTTMQTAQTYNDAPTPVNYNVFGFPMFDIFGGLFGGSNSGFSGFKSFNPLAKYAILTQMMDLESMFDFLSF